MQGVRPDDKILTSPGLIYNTLALLSISRPGSLPLVATDNIKIILVICYKIVLLELTQRP